MNILAILLGAHMDPKLEDPTLNAGKRNTLIQKTKKKVQQYHVNLDKHGSHSLKNNERKISD